MPDIEERIKDIISYFFQVPKENLFLTTSFIIDLGADSFDLIEIAMEIEEEYDISIPNPDEFSIIEDLIKFINKEIARPSK
jgi:acyl carrier protein